jgi:hypothetical protein
MTTLYLFWRESPGLVTNLAQVHNGTVFDLCISTSTGSERNEYVTCSGMKRVRFLGEVPVLYQNNQNQSPVRAHTLHFQGTAKHRIPSFYRGNGFRGKLRADVLQMLQRGKRLAKRSLITVREASRRGREWFG